MHQGGAVSLKLAQCVFLFSLALVLCVSVEVMSGPTYVNCENFRCIVMLSAHESFFI